MKRIFILDDSEDLLDVLKHVLQKEFDLFLKQDTENIIGEITSFRPDLILLDHYVGNVNSTEIMLQLKANDPSFSVPVVLFSAHPKLQETALDIGAIGFIEKPSSVSYIRNYVKNVILTSKN